MSNLSRDIKFIVADTHQRWPKSLNSETLLEQLDQLAERVYAKTMENLGVIDVKKPHRETPTQIFDRVARRKL